MQTTQLNPPETSFHPSKAEWERLLSRVVDSTPFRRSTRLRDFLIYVGNEVVLHGAEDLHEQQIGTAVFGRPAAYDTSQDNIVRVNAMELRKRIDLYFTDEGQNEPLLFEIPRGRYVPVFRLRRLDAIDPPEIGPLKSAPSEEERNSTALKDTPSPMAETSAMLARAVRNALPAILVVVILILTAWLVIAIRRDQQNQNALHKWQSGPALRAFWGNFFGTGLAPEIVLGDTSFLLAQDVLRKPLSLAQYLDYSYRAAQSPDPLSSEARQQEQKDLAIIFSRSSGSLGDFRVARRITELETGNEGTRLLFAREYAGHRLRWNNTIFVGSSKSNPWVELFEDRMAYHFNRSPNRTSSVVTVDHPTGSEQAEYSLSSDPETRTAYCVIVFLPNPTDTGNTLILAGSDSQATEAAGDFLTSEDGLEKLQAVLQQKAFPHFQVLLRISRFSGTPLGYEIVSHRIIKK
ncbi:hypothetical protein SAMN05421771_2125 [Granulicella pectinivorans]|uniref:Adenylate cyclase n=1 Tax=Granulicella pectinivorans TaxID=474950 RepID=A0A1I6M9Q4_9BACT|nr:hypothetical protein [Granulicella pectinivorans]SFS12429.1 hypothetical protein SAMN05421771_2125 [Granulicella pectinivorans]